MVHRSQHSDQMVLTWHKNRYSTQGFAIVRSPTLSSTGRRAINYHVVRRLLQYIEAVFPHGWSEKRCIPVLYIHGGLRSNVNEPTIHQWNRDHSLRSGALAHLWPTCLEVHSALLWLCLRLRQDELSLPGLYGDRRRFHTSMRTDCFETQETLGIDAS